MGAAGPAGAAAPASSGLPSRATWLKATEKAMTGAQAWVATRADNKAPGDRLAVVLDIDNTSLQSHYAYPQAVPAVLRYARYAHSRGVAVVFATGRLHTSLRPVAEDLRGAGYDSFAAMCGRRPGETLVEGKVRCRTTYQKQGYKLIAMVGNLDGDFTGGHWERSWRLPNYGNRLA